GGGRFLLGHGGVVLRKRGSGLGGRGNEYGACRRNRRGGGTVAGRAGSLAPGAEETAQQIAAGLRPDPAPHPSMMVQARLYGQIDHATAGAGLGIWRAI